MKKKFLIVVCVLLIAITTILTLLTTSNGADNWYIEKDEEQGISWYYELVDGEAVNVRTTGGNVAANLTKLIVPQTLGGYPVKSIRGTIVRDLTSWTTMGPVNFYGNLIQGNGNYTSTIRHYENKLKEVVLPEGLKEIGDGSFRDCTLLEKINFPSTLERIGNNAFYYTLSLKEAEFNCNIKDIHYNAFKESSLENIEIKNTEIWQGKIIANIKKATIGEGVKKLEGGIYCNRDADVQISSDIEKLNTNAFIGATDVWVDNYEENVILEKSFGERVSWYHFKNLEKIETSLAEGVKAVNLETNEEFTTAKVGTGNNFRFKLEQEDGYNYENYTVFIESYGTYYNDEKVVTKLDLEFGQEYTLENVRRGKKIYVEARADKLDLNLRQYIWGINNKEMTHSRAPLVEVQEDRTIKYKHTKEVLYPKNGDEVRYGLRVYNEGIIEGSANKITQYIPEGLRFNSSSEINNQYGWEISEDGRIATTEILKDETIDAYTIYDLGKYKEIFIDLIVDTGEIDEFRRLVTVAEITEESSADADSTPGNILLPISGDFMQKESEASNTNSYIKCEEDDMDFEVIATSKNVTHPYQLILNKIDGIDNQLLNGATFDLLDENKKILKTGITANGGTIDFGTIYAYGDKKTRYYIKETYTPEGYKNHLQYLIRLDVVPQEDDVLADDNVRFELDVQDIDVDTSKYETIEISTKEQLMSIESNKEEKYVLTQDIDLNGVTWAPLNVENVKLDGQGHKITNLKIEGESSTNKKVGLFATYSGIIENLTLEDVDINITIPEEEKTDTTDVPKIEDLEIETENEIPAVGGIIGYSKNTILKNCKVTGTIYSEVDNAGGLVGHSKEGTIIVFRDCTNEANVTIGKGKLIKIQEGSLIVNSGSNAGGMIGTSLGPVYVSNCKNTGKITANLWNAGGMIGTSENKLYNTKNVFGQYNEDLNIYVKNEKISGKYCINVKKVDESGNNLLAGAKFSIYDRNKNIIEGLENIELTNGRLEIPETINSIGTDVFYIKETQAPIGYVKLEDTFIKVEIEKIWNKEKQKYETEVKSGTLTETEMENDIPKAKDISTVKTGSLISDTENRNVVLKTNDVTIDQNSINEGVITSGRINAGGFVGQALCSVEITDSNNKGLVRSVYGNAAGIVGQINVEEDVAALFYVDNTENSGEIQQYNVIEDSNYNGNSAAYYASAGIAGTVNSNIEIYNSTNNGTIRSDMSAMSGFIGASYSDYLNIDNCRNNGNINVNYPLSNANGSAGGFLGKGLSYHNLKDSNFNTVNEHSKIVISNCENKANISGFAHTGGIVGYTIVKGLEVTNCNCANSEISSNNCETAGIVACTTNEEAVIENCTASNMKVISSKVTGYGHAGGILGYYGATYSQEMTNGKITVKNCNANEIEVIGNSATGGIVGQISYNYYSDSNLLEAQIEECNTLNSNISTTYKHEDAVGGIVGCIYSGYKGNFGRGDGESVINKCNVTGGSVSAVSSSNGYGSNLGVGGIIAKASIKSIKIKDSNVKDADISYVTGKQPNDDKNCGGIIAFSWGKVIEITNSNVDNVTFTTDCGKIGGIGGHIGYDSNGNIKDGTVLVEECNANNIKINNNAQVTSNTTGITGGIIAYADAADNSIKNSSITNSNIVADKVLVAGGICLIDGNASLQNITVEKTTLEANKMQTNNWETSSSSTFGGVVGYIIYSENASLDNIVLKDSTISTKGCLIAGIIGYSNTTNPINLTNCEVNNSVIQHTKEESNQSNFTTVLAGIIGAANSGSNIENCKVINGSKLLSKGQITAGIVGYSSGLTITGCSVENSEITASSILNAESSASVGGIVCVGNEIKQFENCSVKNTTISARTENVGGLIGGSYASTYTTEPYTVGNMILSHYTYYPVVIDGCTVEGVTINYKNDIEDTLTNPRTIGGAIAVSTAMTTFNNSIFRDITIAVEDNKKACQVGGLIGSNSYQLEISSNNTISAIKIIDLKGTNIEKAGGLIGIDCNNAETSIKDLEISNIDISGGTDIGGLIGDAKKININNVTLADLNLTGSSSTSVLGGLIGRAQTTNYTAYGSTTTYPSKVTLKDIEIKASEGKENQLHGISNNSQNGILIGIADEVEIDTIGTIKVENTKLITNGNTAALIGIVPKLSNLSNVTLNNVEMKSNGTSAGLVGILNNTQRLTIDGVTINNLKVKGMEHSAGIVAMSTNDTELAMKNITANNLTVECSATNTEKHVGGLIGHSNTLELDTIDITDLNVSNDNLSYCTGGLAGSVTGNDGVKLKDITIKASTGKVNTIFADTVNNAIINNTYAGIILGIGKVVESSNVRVSDTNLDGTESMATGTIGMAQTGSVVNDIIVTNVNITGKGRKVGGIVGISNGTISNCTVNNSNITSNSELDGYNAFVGGITGIITLPGSTGVKLENCSVDNTTVKGINAYAGGIVGLSNNTITGTTITDSEVKSIGETARGTGGIIGHGSNYPGSDTAIINSKVIDTKVTGKEQVGGISGGAVYKIQNCYVGGKENERFEEGNYAVEIAGNEGVGSIIGDAGIVSYDSLLMLQMLSNTVKDTKVTRVERPLETGETPDIYGMIGMHNRFTETYSRDETENITGNIASNCEVVNIANP